MISVTGFIVDARTAPPEVQAEARQRGLIPDLPAGRAAAPGTGGANEPEGDGSATGLAEAVRDVVDILQSQPASGSAGAYRPPRKKGRAEEGKLARGEAP